jgi:hypothetical protein
MQKKEWRDKREIGEVKEVAGEEMRAVGKMLWRKGANTGKGNNFREEGEMKGERRVTEQEKSHIESYLEIIILSSKYY